MKRKNQAKKKNSYLPKKLEKDLDDDIQMEDKNTETEEKSPKKHKNNITCNSSRESIIKKRKATSEAKTVESVKIIDKDMPEDNSLKGNKKPPEIKLNKSVVKEMTNKNRRKNEKHLAKKERKDNISEISLEETDNESEIRVVSVQKMERPLRKTRNASKKLDKRNKNNEKENKYSKIQVYIRKEKKGKEKKSIKCELSSTENDDEDKEENTPEEKIEKKNNKRGKKSGYITNIKSSKKYLNNTINRELKPYSSIKTRKRRSTLKDNINTNMENLLGRKRNPERKNRNSKSPNKTIDISESSETEDKNQNKNKKNPSQNKKGKIKAKTPDKIVNKKNSSFNKLSIADILKEFQKNTNKKYPYPELEALNQIINHYSLDKVIDALCKPELEIKNKLDLSLQVLIDSCPEGKLPIFLIKMLFVYFETKFSDKKENKDIKIKRSSSVNTISNPIKTNSEKKVISKISILSSPIDEIKNNSSEININRGGTTIEIDDDKNKDMSNYNSPKFGNYFSFQDINNQNNTEENKGKCIGSHYNKTKDGKIYKYQVYSLDEEGNATFVCYDDNCSGMGNYNLDTKKFYVVGKHNLSYEEHDYIINLLKTQDNAFFDLLKCDKFNAQVFKENGVRNVVFY